MTEKQVPPPLPNTGPATPPPLPKAGVTPPPMPVEKASPLPLPVTKAAPPPLPKAEPVPPPIPSPEVVAPPVPVAPVIPEVPKISVPPELPVKVETSSPTITADSAAVQCEALNPAPASTTQQVTPQAALPPQQPTNTATTSKSISTGAKLGISFAALAILAGVGYGMFGGKGADVSRPEKQAAAMPAPAAAVPAPVAPAPSPNAADQKDDKIRQLEAQLAAAEAEKQRALQAAEQRKTTERPSASTSTPRPAPAPVTPMPAPAAAPAPAPAVQYQPPQHSGVNYRAESRAQGESCNSHSDCQGELKCYSGQCVANTGGQVTAAAQKQQQVPVPKNAKHLVGEFYLFKDSVKELGNGFRGVYAYRNADVAVGNQYHGQVRSQVARYVLNCQGAQFGMDQLYFFSQAHAQGQRVAWQEWQPNQVVLNPIQNAPEADRKVYEYACRK